MSKAQVIGFGKLARQNFKTLNSTKVQDKGALHKRGREDSKQVARYMIG